MSTTERCRCNEAEGLPDVPVAVVGVACRLAGSATNPDALWQMLSTGKSGWSRGAGTRFNLAAFHHPSAVMDGSFNAQGIHLLKQDISQFDNQMFNISAVEAKAIDPQQRLLLEVAYEAFENAGILKESLCASETGVYSAVFNHDYESIQARDPEISPRYRFTGTGPALVSNRISYVFDLRGPSMTIDTACSGSLVAVHQACQAIRTGEIRQALVGGTNLILDPEYMTSMSSMQVLSDHGRCYAFDSRAGGFGRGEGVAAIVLKRLDDAIRDGDPIRSIIRATAINQDGRTPGITMPSHSAQVEVINKAYAQAGLDPKHTCYVEAHGTGTKVGDKIEAGAIAETFACERSEKSPLYVGSIKTNVGHTESTAGLAGLLKALLVLEKGIIPPNMNFASSNEAIPLEKWHIKVPQKSIPWPVDQVRRASVNSFGYGGSNAHIILDGAEEYLTSNDFNQSQQRCRPAGQTPQQILCTSRIHRSSAAASSNNQRLSSSACTIKDNNLENEPLDVESQFASVYEGETEKRRLFVLTHNSDQEIGKLATNLKRHITRQDAKNMGFLDNLAHTLNTRRSQLSFRVAVTAVHQGELISALDDIVKGIVRPAQAVDEPTICFAFTGQGAQWARMGLDLISTYPVFADALKTADQHLISLGADWSLLSELDKTVEHSHINEARLSQPCCTAIQIALVDLYRSWDIQPSVVCGHSSGEIAAAYAAGFLTAGDALSIAFHRGEAVHRLRSLEPQLKGGMLAVGLSVEEVQKYIRHDSLGGELVVERIVIACINSPSSVTLSGDMAPLKDIQRQFEADHVFNRMLTVDVAYHSHHMDLVREHYLCSMKDLEPCTTSNGIRMVSSVTGELIGPRELDACYWAQNMVSCVRFGPALEKAIQLSDITRPTSTSTVDIIAEIGPHSALAGPIKQSLKAMGTSASKVRYYSALLRNINGTKSATQLAGELACCGLPVNFAAINDPANNVRRVTLSDLPTYNWHHTVSHWNEGRASSQYRFRQFPRHDLLGVSCSDSIPLEPKWRNYVRVHEVPWVKGHVFQGQIIFPLSGYICAALEAVRQVTLSSGRMWKDVVCRFRQVHCGTALLIPEDPTGVETLFTLRPYTYSAQESSSTWREFRVFSISAVGQATEHCRGLVSVEQRCVSDPVVEQRENIHCKNSASDSFEISEKKFQRSVNPKRFYSDLRSIGVDYTGPFANITKILTGSGGAVCNISIPETKSSMPAHFEQPHCVHPATLDMCFQTPFAGLRTSGDMKNALVITHIDELDVSSDINAAPDTNLIAQASADSFGAMKFIAQIAVADFADLCRTPLINVKGLVYTSAFGSPSGMTRIHGEYLCHQMKWAMDASCADAREILRLCNGKLLESSATRRHDTYDTYSQKVIRAVLSAISKEDEARMEDHHKKLVGWMRAHKSESFTDAHCASRETVQSLGVDGKMLVRVGDHMLDILKGKTDALTTLLEEDLLYEVYSNENTHRCHDQLDEYLRLLSFKNPNMDILEIGAGTAGTTVPVLEAFSTRSGGLLKKTNIKKYVFTDISTGFFEKSKEKLQGWEDILEFKKLDVETDIENQGFVEGTFDLIIASNVLHATQSIAHTLRNVRRLLKPGGKLIMVEITEPHMTWPMIVGTLPGWWLGAADGRVDSPSLTSSGWDNVLRSTDFTGVDVELKDYESAYEHQLSVLISTATSDIYNDAYPAINIVCSQADSSFANAFAELMSLSDPESSVRQTSLNEFEPSDGIHVVLLEATSPLINQCDSSTFELIKRMLTTTKSIIWVTRGAAIDCEEPERALITGLARTARSEDHLLNLVTVDLDPNESSTLELAKHVKMIFDVAFGPNRSETSLSEFEYSVRDGVVLIPRILEDESLEDYLDVSGAKTIPLVQQLRQQDRSLDLCIETPGLLETFYWADSATHSRKPAPEEVRIKVGAVPLNFKDLMTGMGQLDGLTAMLIECSGVVDDVGNIAGHHFRVGDRVCAVGYKSFATTSNVDYRLVQRIPDGLPSETAAALQISYATALYALRDVARLQTGESVLIHSAAGGFGQAAIAIAKYIGAGQIYVTVSSAEKKTFLMEKFGIPDDNIFSSRTVSFKDGLMRLTKGTGVDVILNSLSGDLMFETYKCLAPFGRFVEIGKKDLLSNTRLEMRYLEKNVSFSTVDLSMLMEFKPYTIQELLKTVFDLVRKQDIELLGPIMTKSITELETAFRLMQTGKHIGKIVMILNDDAEVKVERLRPAPPKLKEDSSYLIIGGTGGLGKAIIRHLTKLGAKHIIAMSRSGDGNDAAMALIKECRSSGVKLVIHQGSVLSIGDIQRAVALAGSRPIHGVIQGAMVLKDSTLSNMSYEQWQAAVLPKVQGTLNLHSVFGESLDFFTLLSSGTGIIGSYGQGNYSAGNTFQDAFARWRTARGLPARTIDLGPVEGEGYAAENENALEFTLRQGMGVVKLGEVMTLIDHSITYPRTKDVASSQTLVATRRADPASGSDEATIQRPDPKFAHLWAASSRGQIVSVDDGEFDFRDALRSATTKSSAIETAQIAIINKLSKLLAMPVEDIHPQRAVGTYGMDSLISVELRNWMAVQLEAHVQQFELMGAKSIQELATMAAERSRLVSPAVLAAAKQ